MRRILLALVLPLFLAACGAESVWAPDELVARNIYSHPGPTTLTLITMKNTSSGNGAHTALMINASQRVLWDPAGTFAHSSIAERNDVIFGVTPRLAEFYISYHSRVTFYTVSQTVEVSPEVAEMALRAVMAYGAVPKAFCTQATAEIMRSIPGFENFRVSFFPNNLHDQFAQLPNVVTSEYRENDSDDNSGAIAEIDAQIRAGQ